MSRIISLYIISVSYAFLRYVVFSPENLANVPVFVMNKGLSMAAAFSFALAFWNQWRARIGSDLSTAGGGTEGHRDSASPGAVHTANAAAWFRAGIFGVVAHVPMSLALLHPGYFREFFDGERMSFNGETVLFFGALTAGGIYLLGRMNWTDRQRWWLSMSTVAMLFSHTLSMGIARGLNMKRSHGYLPPMWLLSMIGIALGGAFLLLSFPVSERPIAAASGNRSE